MSQQAGPRSRGRTIVSWLLFGIAALLFAAVAVMYIQDRRDEQGLPTPPQIAGRNEMINVKQALEFADVSVTFAPGGARSPSLEEAGQVLEVEGETLYVFIYPSAADREADSSTIDLSTVPLLDVRGTPITGAAPKVFAGSNVIAVLMDGDDALAAKVQRVIEGLP